MAQSWSASCRACIVYLMHPPYSEIEQKFPATKPELIKFNMERFLLWQLLKRSFSNLNVVIKEDSGRSIPFGDCAARLATVCLAGLIERQNNDVKNGVLESLMNVCDHDNAVSPTVKVPLAQKILWIENVLNDWERTDRIEEGARTMFMSECIGALRGRSFDERSINRIEGYLVDAIAPHKHGE